MFAQFARHSWAVMDAFPRIPGEYPYADYNGDRGVRHLLESSASKLLVEEYQGDFDELGRYVTAW